MSSARGLKACNQCDLKFYSERVLELHMASHLEADKVTVATHDEVGVAREEPVIRAATPDSASVSVQELDNHGLIPKRYNCAYCEKKFGTLKYLEHHLSGKRHPKNFAQISAIIEDQIEGEGGNLTIIPCLKCPSTHVNYEDLELHVTFVHVNSLSNEEIFSCPDCGKCFSSLETLEDHVRNFHDKTSNRKACNFCRMTFSRGANWKHHLTTPAHQNTVNRLRSSK